MKDYREKEMKYLLGVLLLIFVYYCTPIFEFISALNLQSDELVSIIKYIVSLGVISLSVFLLDCMISSETKNKLVGLFFIPLAGSVIFTKISDGKVKDNRFTDEEARRRYADIINNRPQNRKKRLNYENSCWYKIYRKHKEEGAIKQSQKDYLTCRDLYIETILFLFMYFISIILFSNFVSFSWEFVGILIIICIITNCSTYVKMNRFVNTVIAVDIAKEEE